MLMTVKQYAEHTGAGIEAVRQRIRRGRLPAIKLGRDWLIDSSETFKDRRYKDGKVIIQVTHEEDETS